MKRITISLLLIFIVFNISAQKFGHFSSEYIVKQMPAYQQAQLEIENLSQAWMEDVKDKYFEIGSLQNKLQSESVLLTPEMFEEREHEIELKLKEAIEYQYKIFGPEGLFFLKKKELIKPELDQIFEAVERVCKKHRLDYLIDKSGDLLLFYTNPVHDYTDYVLEELDLGDINDVIK